VDGFNLYYGAVKGTAWRWLDIECLCRCLLPRDTLNRIRYFTARVAARPDDPQAPQRQEAYLRALRTIPILTIHEGFFLSRVTPMRLAGPSVNPSTVLVVRTEEKGSDVNLATCLLLDSFRRDCDTAVIISNDSDLLEPVRVVRRELGMQVGVINPHPSRQRSRSLASEASFFKQLRPSVLPRCQFPRTMSDGDGVFSRPDAWAIP
jgi:uncharacterized LabA/DUF88 family protein